MPARSCLEAATLRLKARAELDADRATEESEAVTSGVADRKVRRRDRAAEGDEEPDQAAVVDAHARRAPGTSAGNEPRCRRGRRDRCLAERGGLLMDEARPSEWSRL